MNRGSRPDDGKNNKDWLTRTNARKSEQGVHKTHLHTNGSGRVGHMLGLERRIVLEDHLGEKHALHLLEVIEDRFFVLLPPAYAAELAALQEENDLDEAIEILATGVGVLGAH